MSPNRNKLLNILVNIKHNLFGIRTNELRKYIKSGNAAQAYSVGKEILKQRNDEYASFAAAWGAQELGKDNEALELIKIALKRRPNCPKYMLLQGKTFLKMDKEQEALEIFQEVTKIRPKYAIAWKNIIKICSDLKIKIDLPRNVYVVSHKTSQAYSARDWIHFNKLLKELFRLDPMEATFWKLASENYLLQLKNPVEEWAAFHKQCQKKRPDLAFKAFTYFFTSLVHNGDLKELLHQLPKFKNTYKKPYPLINMPGICALFVRDEMFSQCLTFLDEIEQSIENEDIKKTFRLRTFPYRWLSEKREITDANGLSSSLMEMMRSLHYPESAPMQILKDCDKCWETIREARGELILDLAYNPLQTARLKLFIRNALVNQKPFSLVRLGDGESYAFSQRQKEMSQPDLVDQMEKMWWGKNIPILQREYLVQNFFNSLKTADLIGFPGPLRMARDLSIERRKLLSTRERKYKTLFTGVIESFKVGNIPLGISWVDEYCNFALSDQKYLEELIESSVSTVIITCFEVPKNNFLNHPKVKVVFIPPHSRVSTSCTRFPKGEILPEIYGDIERQLKLLIVPGTLLLVSAGFAGKGFIKTGKDAGAVSIDFGAAMDGLFGFKTRAAELHTHFF